MPDIKRLDFSATIGAPVELVWDTMLGAETYPRWTAPFTVGSYFVGSWQQGSRIRFLAPSGEGMVAEIAESRPREFVSIRHIGVVANDVEDTDSDAVRAWAPAYENYRFTPVPDGTRVDVEQDVMVGFEQYMMDTWPKALAALKALCEGKGDG